MAVSRVEIRGQGLLAVGSANQGSKVKKTINKKQMIRKHLWLLMGMTRFTGLKKLPKYHLIEFSSSLITFFIFRMKMVHLVIFFFSKFAR